MYNETCILCIHSPHCYNDKATPNTDQASMKKKKERMVEASAILAIAFEIPLILTTRWGKSEPCRHITQRTAANTAQAPCDNHLPGPFPWFQLASSSSTPVKPCSYLKEIIPQVTNLKFCHFVHYKTTWCNDSNKFYNLLKHSGQVTLPSSPETLVWCVFSFKKSWSCTLPWHGRSQQFLWNVNFRILQIL